MAQAVETDLPNKKVRVRLGSGRARRGRPQRQSTTPLGSLIVTAMKLLGLSYKDIVSESERFARLSNNSDLRIGKSTLGDIVSGSIRQPGPAKLESLRRILKLSRTEIDAAIGLQPGGRLEMTSIRTHEISIETVTRHRKIRMPFVGEDADLEVTQFLEPSVEWAEIEVEYLGLVYPPHVCYVVIGEEDVNASALTPVGSRLLVNKLRNEVRPAENVSFHQRELFYVRAPYGFTCVYVELVPGDKIVLIPHPESGRLREDFNRDEVTIIGQVVGVLYPG